MNNNENYVPEALQEFFAQHPRIALGFSGGCDSAYLLYAARACRAELGLYHVHSCFQPAFELEDAQKLAAQFECELHLIEADVLSDEQVRSNPADRCYHCKRRIFGEILRAAAKDGYTEIMDGTNASDSADDRPGMRALGEMLVLSPLRLCGILKEQVRTLSRSAGLFTWNKPAYACLATRIPTGTAIEAKMLKKIEHGENALMKMGFEGFRVRVNGCSARLEMREEQLPLLLEKRGEVLAALEADFKEITLDLRTRRDQ